MTEGQPFPAYFKGSGSICCLNFLSCQPALKAGFFLTPAAEKTKTQGKNSSQKLKEKTQPPGGFSRQLGKTQEKNLIFLSKLKIFEGVGLFMAFLLPNIFEKLNSRGKISKFIRI